MSRAQTLLYSVAAIGSIGVTAYGLRSFYLSHMDPLSSDHLINVCMTILDDNQEVRRLLQVEEGQRLDSQVAIYGTSTSTHGRKNRRPGVSVSKSAQDDSFRIAEMSFWLENRESASAISGVPITGKRVLIGVQAVNPPSPHADEQYVRDSVELRRLWFSADPQRGLVTEVIKSPIDRRVPLRRSPFARLWSASSSK